MKEPTNVGEVRSFLWMVNQLEKFIPQLAEKDKPLRDLLSKKNCWILDVGQVTAFETLKEALSSPHVLAMYDPNRHQSVSLCIVIWLGRCSSPEVGGRMEACGL